MASTGQRYVETTDTVIDTGAGIAAAAGYFPGQLIVDNTTGNLYVQFGGAWVLVGGQT